MLDPNENAAQLEIVSRRIFSTPRHVVFEAFANPHHLVHWWGPNGFTNTFHEFDLRPGGTWRFIMNGPDGKQFPNTTKFIEIVKAEKIVFEHMEPMHWFRMTMTFTEVGEATELTWRMRFETAEETERIKHFVVEANEQNFDRLQARLVTMLAVNPS